MLLAEPNSAAMLLIMRDFVIHLVEYGVAAPALALFLIGRLCRAGNLESSEITQTKHLTSNLLLWPTEKMVTYPLDYYSCDFVVEHEELELTTR